MKPDLSQIVKDEEANALDYSGELAKKRAVLLDYYNMKHYGDEVEGQSQVVTSDVADTIEWMLPSLLRMFTAGKHIAVFDSYQPAFDKEAEEKTLLTNHVFSQQNNGVLILHSMFKDALLQYCGVVKVVAEEYKTSKIVRYEGLSEIELNTLTNIEGVKIEEAEYEERYGKRVYDVDARFYEEGTKVCYYTIPPEEFVINRDARDFERPRFIGHRSPKTRSELIEMGIDKKLVESLSTDNTASMTEGAIARWFDVTGDYALNPSNHEANDVIYVGEYYVMADMNGDGIAEQWRVLYADNKVLEQEEVDDHPFACCVPVPITHRAIGTCPAEQAATIQRRKSVLVRQMLDNIYQSNYPRMAYSNRVDLDDLFTLRSGGGIEVDTDMADVAGHVQPIVVPPMIDSVLKAIEYTDMEREVRTGITRYSQGLDAEALNKTATGFKGIMDASQQRLDMIARLFADGGVKQLFVKTAKALQRYQDTAMQIKVLGQPMEINPAEWTGDFACRIDVGLGAGDKQEKIANLNTVIAMQMQFMQSGMILADQAKIYNALDKLTKEVGLKSAEEYFNNPEVPETTLQAQLEQAQLQIAQLQQQIQQNPLAEVENIKAQAKMAEVQSKDQNQMRQFIMEQAQKDRHFKAQMMKDLTELELKYSTDVPGASV